MKPNHKWVTLRENYCQFQIKWRVSDLRQLIKTANNNNWYSVPSLPDQPSHTDCEDI